MGYRVARKHARKLRRIALACGFALPALLLLIAFFIPGVMAALCALLAAEIALIGVLTERWLFFAEARHAVTLYYGRSLAA
jgi:DMSO reductase anchor subunit